MPILRQESETVSPLAGSRSTSRSNRATSSAVRRFFMGPSWAQSNRRLPFQVDQFLGSRPDVPLQTGTHHSPAEARAPAHGVVRIRNAQHAPGNEVGDLAVKGRLQTIPDVS